MEGEEDGEGEGHLPEVAFAQLFVEYVAEAKVMVLWQLVFLLQV